MKDIYLIIHGHFYQPPRFNPWSGEYDDEPSAKPFRNWNERISRECYGPNGYSRVLDRYGRVLEIINNYRYMSFNFGPTLLSWIEKYDPDTYASIITADWGSRRKSEGRGSAMAQAYNHMIMPLASEKDRKTQVIWGIRDFRHRFGRHPEGMWLPETGVNAETVNTLIENGIRFTILAPTQAARFKPIEDGDDSWTEVGGEGIDPGRVYRTFYRNSDGTADRSRFLDVFFYNKPVSTEISFQHLLRNSDDFARRIVEESRKNQHEPRLVVVATDGEVYGHHEPFGDMCLSYLFSRKVHRYGIKVINFSSFLALHEPKFEVELVEGKDGTGSSWSCAHGVDRWRWDCGCSVGGESWWHQGWRHPLRESFNLLRDSAAVVFEREASALGVESPWDARDAYIDVILSDFSVDGMDRFISEHVSANRTDDFSRETLINLFEAQRFLMMMYTSCAWFFADVSGVESMIAIRFAARAFMLMEQYFTPRVRDELLSALRHASSNLPGIDAAGLFLKILESNGSLPVIKTITHEERADETPGEGEIGGEYRLLTEKLEGLLAGIEDYGCVRDCHETIELLELLDSAAAENHVDRFHAENIMFKIIRKRVAPAVRRLLAGKEDVDTNELKRLILLAERMNFNMEKYRKRLAGMELL